MRARPMEPLGPVLTRNRRSQFWPARREIHWIQWRVWWGLLHARRNHGSLGGHSRTVTEGSRPLGAARRGARPVSPRNPPPMGEARSQWTEKATGGRLHWSPVRDRAPTRRQARAAYWQAIGRSPAELGAWLRAPQAPMDARTARPREGAHPNGPSDWPWRPVAERKSCRWGSGLVGAAIADGPLGTVHWR